MSFFVAPVRDFVDEVTDSMATRPEFQERYKAIEELREIDRQGLYRSVDQASKAGGFFRVASLQGQLLDLAEVLDPEFISDKRRFYRFLDKHPKHVTYDRRKRAVANQITMVEGKPIL